MKTLLYVCLTVLLLRSTAFAQTSVKQDCEPTVAVITARPALQSDRVNPWMNQHVVYLKESEARFELGWLLQVKAPTPAEIRKIDALSKALNGLEGVREAQVYPCPGNCGPRTEGR